MEKIKLSKIPVRINELLKLPVTKMGKKGDPLIKYKNFIIVIKKMDKRIIRLNEFVKIRITKILDKFAIAEIVI